MTRESTTFRSAMKMGTVFGTALLLFLLNAVSFGQGTFSLRLDTLMIFNANDLNLGQPELSKMGSGDGRLWWPTKDENDDQVLVAFDCNKRVFGSIRVPKNTCLDREFTLRGVACRDSLFFVWSDRGLIFDAKGKVHDCIKVVDISSGHFSADGYIAFSNYYREQTDNPYVTLPAKKGTQRFDLPGDHFELSRFEPNKVLAVSDAVIARLSISEPKLYTYSSKFEPIDSVVFSDQSWLTMNAGFSEKELNRIRSKAPGFFEFYWELFDRGLSKSTNLQFVNDTTLFVGYMQGIMNQYYQIVQLGKDGTIEHVSEPVRAGSGQCNQEGVDRLDPERFQQPDLPARAVAIDGFLYYVTFGAHRVPWGESCEVYEEILNSPNPNRDRWLHIFRYAIVEL